MSLGPLRDVTDELKLMSFTELVSSMTYAQYIPHTHRKVLHKI